MEKIIAIIQARTSSTRLPRKILMKLGDKSILENIVDRVSRAKLVHDLVVATSTEKSDDRVEKLLEAQHINCFRGSLDNVLERFYHCAKEYKANTVIRLTADNALIAPEIIDEAIHVFMEQSVDYLYYKASLPLGMCVEIFTFKALERAFYEADDSECLEHVTPYIRKNPNIFSVLNYSDENDKNNSALRFTIDTPQDYEFVSRIYNYFTRNDFMYTDILELLARHPEWLRINHAVKQISIKYKGKGVI